MKRIHVNKIASSVARLQIARQPLITDTIVAREGYVIAVRALDRKTTYNALEDPHGRMTTVHPGDVIVGVLGQRRALHGHAGTVPEHIAVGDILHLLNLGGVIGLCGSSNPGVGPALRVEVLGAVLAFPVIDSRQGVPAHIGMKALEPDWGLKPEATPPVVFISGTCMNSGKTRAACEIVRVLAREGLDVAACKLTGVALKRDVLGMVDCGANRALTFVDAGLPSTTSSTAPAAARAIFAALSQPDSGRSHATPDVIVAELGDGLLGEYGVLPILKDELIGQVAAVHVCCASDPVGAFGAVQIFEGELGRRPDLFSGPATDNAVGSGYIRGQLDIPAYNALMEPESLGRAVLTALKAQVGDALHVPSIDDAVLSEEAAAAAKADPMILHGDGHHVTL
ncbi:MAG: hypothetical protein AAFX99_03305 [Myxococcota bacterium]